MYTFTCMCPEAGTNLLYQRHATPHGFTHHVPTLIVLPLGTRQTVSDSSSRSASPESLLNIDDLSFFASLQADDSLVSKDTRIELLVTVVSCWQAYPLECMTAVWCCLYSSHPGILSAEGK